VRRSDASPNGLRRGRASGPTRFRFTNDGGELHELALFRRNDGADQPVEELLQLPDEELSGPVTPVGEPAFAVQGETGQAVYDLEPGSYITVCLVPVGLTSEEAAPAPMLRPMPPRAWLPRSPSTPDFRRRRSLGPAGRAGPQRAGSIRPGVRARLMPRDCLRDTSRAQSALQRHDDIKVVVDGAWGLVIMWNDSHATGIFPFESLRRWDEGAAFGRIPASAEARDDDTGQETSLLGVSEA
jgi:hypothetical protein